MELHLAPSRLPATRVPAASQPPRGVAAAAAARTPGRTTESRTRQSRAAFREKLLLLLSSFFGVAPVLISGAKRPREKKGAWKAALRLKPPAICTMAEPSAASNHAKPMDIVSPRAQQQQQQQPQTERKDTATWNFVQMNMTLLPIARPLPVTIAHQRFQEGAVLAGTKPHTPTQRLHHRLRQHTSNISPRRHDTDSVPGLRRATPMSAMHSSDPCGRPPTPSSACGSKRKCPENWCAPRIITGLPRASENAARERSLSENLHLQQVPRGDSGYSSDPMDSRQHPPLSHSPVLQRRASISAGCAAKGGLFKGKRILQLQDEDRRLHPDERAMAPSPSKRSKRQP